MKFSIRQLLFLTAGFLMLAACKKEESKIFFEGGKSPVLTASLPANSIIPLDARTKSNPAVKFNWTNPDYKFNTGVSSQNVSYTLQIDKVGAGFSSPVRQEKSFTSSLSNELTQDELNKMLIQMGYAFDQESSIEVRLKSSLNAGSVPMYSNVLTFKVVPFLDVAVPLPPTDDLWLVGDASPEEWNNAPSDAQKFTRTSLTTWELTVQLSGGKHFLVLPVWGDWKKYSVADNTVPDLWQGGAFGSELSDDFPGPPTSGLYKIELDFTLGRFKVTPQ